MLAVFRSSRCFSRIDSIPINTTFNAKNWLEDIRGYEEYLSVVEVSADSTLSELSPVPSYGTIDSAVAAISYSCVIEPPAESDSADSSSDAASTRQRTATPPSSSSCAPSPPCSGAVEDPGTWTDINPRNRNNSLDDLVDLLLGLHRADRWASTMMRRPCC